jgi:hypothetical protein
MEGMGGEDGVNGGDGRGGWWMEEEGRGRREMEGMERGEERRGEEEREDWKWRKEGWEVR